MTSAITLLTAVPQTTASAPNCAGRVTVTTSSSASYTSLPAASRCGTCTSFGRHVLLVRNCVP